MQLSQPVYSDDGKPTSLNKFADVGGLWTPQLFFLKRSLMSDQ